MSTEIPVLDYAILSTNPHQFVQDLKNAASQWGFFFLKNHGIAQSDVDKNFDLAAKFFHGPPPGEEYKINTDNVGYSGRWQEGYGKDDHISFNFAGKYRASMNLPPMLAAEYDSIQEFKKLVWNLSVELLRGFAVALDLEPDHFAKWHDINKAPGMNLRYMYYPENHLPEEGQTRIREHSDFGTITVLWQKDVGGLEVLSPTGKWVTAPVIPGAPLINIGDFLQIWSAGELKSTIHRLTFKNGSSERYSMPCFIGANEDALLAPIKPGQVKLSCDIDGMTAGEYNRRRVHFLHHGGDPKTTPFITREDTPYQQDGAIPAISV